MNTKLLIAASATALLGFAGAASAIDLSLVNVTTTANTNDVNGGARSIEAHRYVASEVSGAIFADPVASPGGVYSTWVEARLLPSATAVMPSGNALLTFELSGAGATFRDAAVAAGNVLQDGQPGVPAGTCTPTRSVVSVEATKVVYLVSGLAGCNNGNPIDVVLPVNFSNSSANVTLSSSFVTEGPGTPIDNVAPANMLNRPVITFIDGYNISVAAAGGAALVADVTTTPAYLTFEGGAANTTQTIGTATLGVRTLALDGITPITVAVNIDGAPNAVNVNHYSNDTDFLLTATSGGFTGLRPSIESEAAPGSIIGGTAYARTVAAAAVLASAYTIDYRVADTGAAIPGVLPAATGVPIQGATFSGRASTVVSVPAAQANTTTPVTFTEVGTGEIKPVTLGGTNFVAPWVSINGGAAPQLRLSNAINQPTGAIELTALAWSGGTPARITCTLGDFVPAKAVIPANGAINIVRADFQACFGSSVPNADVRVTIRSNVNGLNAKLRVQDGAGDTFEQTLGSLSSYRVTAGASNGLLTSQ